MEQAQLALRDRICHLGISPDLTADVLCAFDAQNRARARWGVGAPVRPARRAAPLAPNSLALRDVPQQVAPFCHDVLLYRAFIGAAYQDAARDWLGPAMWHLTCALGGWRRVHAMPLTRLCDAAMAARAQAPSCLRAPAHPLRTLGARQLWELTRPWARKYPALAALDTGLMAQRQLAAGAWLWVMDRADADARRRGDDDLLGRVMRLAARVEDAVGLVAERR